MEEQLLDEIRTYPCPDCHVCGTQGKNLYRDLSDRLFGTPGKWNFKKCSNPRCGLVWLDPMPAEEATSLAYRNYYTHQDTKRFPDTWARRAYRLVRKGYLAQKYGYCSGSTAKWKKIFGMLLYLHPGRREDVDFNVMYMPANPHGRLLEIGCGSGQLLEIMQQMGWQAEGVDFDPSAVENARKKALQVRLGTLEKQGYPKDYFDVIFMSHLIEHVHDPLRLLEEVCRIIKPNGRLIMVTPNNESLGHKFFKEAWRGLEVPRHLYIFTMNALRDLAIHAGFTVKRARITVRNARGIYLASRSIKKAAHDWRGKAVIPNPTIQAEIWQFVEWIMCRFVNTNLGEELVLIVGKKP